MKISKFYTCRYDRPFKEIILNKNNVDLLKWFLEDILKVKIKSIKTNTIEMNNGNIHVKRKYADVLLKTDIGKIEIEVNACNENYVRPRNMSYLCNIYGVHTLVGEDYNEDTPIIQINFSYGLKDEEKIRVYKIQDDSGKKYVNNFLIYEINMDYYKRIWRNGSGNEKDIDENKYYIMLDLEENELKRISKKDRVVEKYMEDLVRVNSNPEFQAYMTVEEDARKIQNSRIRAGIEKGMQKGMQKGIQQGMKKGIVKTARKMLAKNIDIQTICECTGLSVEKIKEL